MLDTARSFDEVDNIEFDPREEKIMKKYLERRKNKFADKLEAVFWMIASIATVYYSDILDVVLESVEVARFYFNLSLVCMLVLVGLGTYFVVYLDMIKKIDSTWEEYAPNLLYGSSLLMVVSATLMLIGLWPVYKLLTPVIMFVLFMGFVHFFALLPM